MPEDSDIAQKQLLDQFENSDLKAVYIKAYTLNWDDLFDKIKFIDQKGIPVYILTDYMQARTPSSWEKIVELHKFLKNGEIILTTAGGERMPSQIWHSKAISFVSKDICQNWCGSVNFSNSGFYQGNTASLFESEIWSKEFIDHFEKHKKWALSEQPQKQIEFILNNPVAVQDVEINEENSDLYLRIELLENILLKYRITTVLLMLSIFLLITLKRF